MITYKITALSGFLILTICVADAQERTLATYGDWTVSCAKASRSGAGKSCGLVQVQKNKGQTTTVSQIGIGRDIKTDPVKISIEIGANAWIPTGVKLTASDNAFVIIASFKWCISTRCLADAELSDVDIKNLRAQKDAGRIVYKSASQTDVSIPVSFSGFSEALNALQKE